MDIAYFAPDRNKTVTELTQAMHDSLIRVGQLYEFGEREE